MNLAYFRFLVIINHVIFNYYNTYVIICCDVFDMKDYCNIVLMYVKLLMKLNTNFLYRKPR